MNEELRDRIKAYARQVAENAPPVTEDQKMAVRRAVRAHRPTTTEKR